MVSKNRIATISPFTADLKALRRKHYDLSLLSEPIHALEEGNQQLLTSKYDDHALKGNWTGFREFHVQGDWLVVYFRDDDTITLVLTRTGKHDELFDAKITRQITRSYRSANRADF